MDRRRDSYFLKLFATHQNSNNTKFIRKGQEFITKRNDVLRELCNLYRELYQSLGVNENKIKTYVDKIYLVNILSDKEKQPFEQISIINECDKAVTTLKSNKSSGLDGSPGEFCQTFLPELRTRFYICLLKTFNDNNMTFSQKLSLITLIFKRGTK